MSFSIPTYGPGTPFFTGTFADPRTIPYTVNLDGRDYPVDLTGYRHNGVQRFRNGVVTSDEVNDALLNPEGAWWRYRFSWHLGAGQEIDELDEQSLAARYEASRGVDVWTKYQACLLPATETKNKSLTASDISMVATDTLVYVSDGTTVQRCSDLTAATPTWSTITGLSGTVTCMTTDGTDVYIGTTVEVFVVSPASLAAASFSSSAEPSDNLAVAGNRLILANANEIGEESTTAFTPVYTHFQSSFRWTAIFSVGSRIYLGGYSGNRSEIYTTQVDTSSGALALANEAAVLASGELIYDAISYAGNAILATSKGLRFAQPSGDGTLTYGPLIADYGAAYALTAEGRFVWAAVENFPGTGTGVVRLALDEFTDTLLPAYAPDVFTEDTSDEITAVARFGETTVFAVSADEVYGHHDTEYVTTGYIESGDMTFGTVEDKAISELRIQYDALAANESVRVDLTDRDGTAIGNKTDVADGSEEMTLDVVGNNVSRARVKLTLNGDGTTTPCLRQWRMRAYPVAPGVEEWLVPLIIHSQVVVNDSEGQVMYLDPWEATARIRDAWQTQEIVLYKEGDYSFRVRIDNFQIDSAEWRDGSDYYELTCTVRLLST